jgi:hypothetical protein
METTVKHAPARRRGYAAALTALALAALVSGCVGDYREKVAGTGPVVTETRAAGPFHRIEVDGSADVRVTVGPSPSVAVQAQKNIADLMDTTVSGGTLTIQDKKPYSSDEHVVVRVTTPELDAYSIRGASDATIVGAKGPKLNLTISGAGNVAASGKVDELSLSCSGAGNGNLRNLEARDAVVSVSGVGNANVNASQTLDVTVAGVGSVTYHGSPRIVQKSVVGVGTITQD